MQKQKTGVETVKSTNQELEESKAALALKALRLLNSAYTEESKLFTRLAASLGKKLSRKDISALHSIILTRR